MEWYVVQRRYTDEHDHNKPTSQLYATDTFGTDSWTAREDLATVFHMVLDADDEAERRIFAGHHLDGWVVEVIPHPAP